MKIFFDYVESPLRLQLVDESGALLQEVLDEPEQELSMFERGATWAIENGYEGPFALMAGDLKGGAE